MAKKKNINKKLLKELLNRETFTYEKGADFGDGKAGDTNQIIANKTSDEIDTMTVQPPSNKLPNDYLGVGRGFIGEGKGIAEAIFSKVEDGDTDGEIIDQNKAELKKVKLSLKKIDFQKVSEKEREALINKIRNNG